MGADDENKQEIEPALMASCAIVVDLPEQAVTIGDLHHAIRAGAVTTRDVRAGRAGHGLEVNRAARAMLHLAP